ncbi:hypothetical protein NIES3585_44160 [Nodularia sp. NIES-3585]|nr:hypothetical protein NIES3585_44160 [Nodularia sp. NIES-3585]
MERLYKGSRKRIFNFHLSYTTKIRFPPRLRGGLGRGSFYASLYEIGINHYPLNLSWVTRSLSPTTIFG